MKHVLSLLFLFLAASGISYAQDDYKIFHTKEDGKKMIRIDALVPVKMEKKAYNAMAEKIKATLETKYKKTVVDFYLGGTGPAPFRAAIITMSKKDFGSRIIGLPLEREGEFLEGQKTPEGATEKGRWFDEHTGTFHWWYEQGGETIMYLRESLIKSAKTANTKLVKVSIGEETRFMMLNADPHLKPYYLVQEDGALGYYEHEKLVRVFPVR